MYSLDIEDRLIACPYCGEEIAIPVDLSAGDQQLIEDCSVCCRPIELALRHDEVTGVLEVSARRDDDTC